MSSRVPEVSEPPNRSRIETWFRDVVAELTGIPAASVDVHAPLTRFGIDSATALIVTDMLAEWLRIDLDPTLLYEHDTIDALASYLERRVLESAGQRAADVSGAR